MHASGRAGEYGDAAALFEQAQAGAGGRDGNRDAGSGLAQTAGGGNGAQQAQIGEIKVHRGFSFDEGFVLENAILRRLPSL
ncbi:hypothetical protein D3C80_1655500 [compost metagenome]